MTSLEAIDEVLEKRMSGRGREQLLALNKQVLREGMKLAGDAAQERFVSAFSKIIEEV